jgi:hypothetical protein
MPTLYVAFLFNFWAEDIAASPVCRFNDRRTLLGHTGVSRHPAVVENYKEITEKGSMSSSSNVA